MLRLLKRRTALPRTWSSTKRPLEPAEELAALRATIVLNVGDTPPPTQESLESAETFIARMQRNSRPQLGPGGTQSRPPATQLPDQRVERS